MQEADGEHVTTRGKTAVSTPSLPPQPQRNHLTTQLLLLGKNRPASPKANLSMMMLRILTATRSGLTAMAMG